MHSLSFTLSNDNDNDNNVCIFSLKLAIFQQCVILNRVINYEEGGLEYGGGGFKSSFIPTKREADFFWAMLKVEHEVEHEKF